MAGCCIIDKEKTIPILLSLRLFIYYAVYKYVQRSSLFIDDDYMFTCIYCYCAMLQMRWMENTHTKKKRKLKFFFQIFDWGWMNFLCVCVCGSYTSLISAGGRHPIRAAIFAHYKYNIGMRRAWCEKVFSFLLILCCDVTCNSQSNDQWYPVVSFSRLSETDSSILLPHCPWPHRKKKKKRLYSLYTHTIHHTRQAVKRVK